MTSSPKLIKQAMNLIGTFFKLTQLTLMLLFFVLAFTFQSCKPYQDISVSAIEGVYLNKLSKDGIEAEVKVKIKNPNSIGFKIYPSKFDVNFSGIGLGEAKLNRRVKIRANTEQVYSFYLKSAMSNFNFLDAAKLFNLDNMGKVAVKGDLKVGKVFYKKSLPVVYNDKVKLFR